jgi:hypothetical protein
LPQSRGTPSRPRTTVSAPCISRFHVPRCRPSSERAVALLHNFHYPETVKAFQGVIKDDPDCAIAYWGLAISAMPNPLVPPFPPAVVETAQAAIRQGKAAKTQSPREAEYLAAIDTFFKGYDNTAYRPRAEAYAGDAAAQRRLPR